MSLPAFKAHLNGTNQTGVNTGAWTQVIFTAESYDIGGYFASSTWTPPAGKVSMIASCHLTGNVTSNTMNAVAIYKNASQLIFAGTVGNPNDTGTSLVCDDVANGTDAYTMYGWATGGTGRAFSGATDLTYFSGYWYSA